MDSRSLRELELLAVARLYGLGESPPGTAPAASWAGLRVQVAQSHVRRGAPAGPSASWLFVAGADDEGEPFTGPAGKLFDAMLAAIGCARGADLEAEGAMREARPGVVVALGKAAAARLLGTEATLASQRGRAHRCQGVPLVVTLHPGELLDRPLAKAQAWEDLVLARRSLAAS